MILKDFLEAIEFQVRECVPYHWSCYGERCMIMDGYNEYGEASCVYSLETSQVFEVSISDKLADRYQYTWVDPDYKDEYEAEAKSRHIEPYMWLDGEKYSVTDSEEDILDKVTAILNNRSFDETVVITLIMTPEEKILIETAAANLGITIDKFVERAIMEVAYELVN
jgi:hypothetical protein